jgi:hypothetical protein
MERFIRPEQMGTPRGKSKETAKKEIADYYADKFAPAIEEADMFPQEESYDEEYDDEQQQEVIPDGLISTSVFFQENGAEYSREIHSWYEKAMARRNREGLEYERFNGHFFEGGSSDETYLFGDKKKGFLLGYVRYGVFIPTHFAPKSIRTGYELMKELGGNDKLPAVMSITPDLIQTIAKMPEWHVTDLNFLSNFRGGQVDKMIVYNSHPNVQNLMWGLVKEYIDERDNYSDNQEAGYF